MAHYIKVFKEHYPPRLNKGVKDLLVKLRHEGKRMFIVTQSRADIASIDLEQLKIIEYFERIWGANDLKYRKPDPRSLNPVIKYLKSETSSLKRVVLIGDSVRDYLAAKGAGFSFIATLTGQDSREKFITEGLNSRNIVSDLTKLL